MPPNRTWRNSKRLETISFISFQGVLGEGRLTGTLPCRVTSVSRQRWQRQSESAFKAINGGRSSHQHPECFVEVPGPHRKLLPHAMQVFRQVEELVKLGTIDFLMLRHENTLTFFRSHQAPLDPSHVCAIVTRMWSGWAIAHRECGT